MDQIKIGKYIAEKRKALGLTQVELADKLGMSNKSVSKWERGVCLPDVSVYNDLCSLLGISLNEFLAGEDIEKDAIEKKSEENIISVTEAGNKRSKKFRKAAVTLGIIAFILAAGILIILAREGYFANNYIRSYDINSNASQTARTAVPLGYVQLYEFSTDKEYKEMEITVYKKDDGRMRNKPVGSAEFPLEYVDGTGTHSEKKGTLAVICEDYRITLSSLGMAYKLDLRDVIEGVEDKGGTVMSSFNGNKKIVQGKKTVLYALDYGYDGTSVVPYDDLDKIIEDQEGYLDGYNDLVFVTVCFN